uniref:Xylanolytic transcriptional activator regulatory domain-containing protein n=1 Tax=Mycena chlorophos TaxID=658473 RepID=A0ABQ0LPT6_MYCCL|nr:predicted protein [Mycena chlorophos]
MRKATMRTLLYQIQRTEAQVEQESKLEDGKSLGWWTFQRSLDFIVMPFAPPHPSDSDAALSEVTRGLSGLSLHEGMGDPGFQGRSGAVLLVKAAADAKSSSESVSGCEQPTKSRTLRPWTTRLWDTPSHDLPHTVEFPAPALLDTLLRLYFTRTHTVLPLLHRPTFEKQLAAGLHLTHIGLARIVLLVCALGSTSLPAPYYSRSARFSLGWGFYSQFLELKENFPRQQATVADIQASCLAAAFLNCMDNVRSAMMVSRTGLRRSLDIGAHRGSVSPVADEGHESSTRVFWFILFIDLNHCVALGRGVLLDPMDMSIGSSKDYADGVPGYMDALITLYRIMNFIHLALYPLNRSMDTGLDYWFKNLPSPLRWNPDTNSGSKRPLDQSAALHCLYYYLRILLHRRYLPAIAFSSGTEPEPRTVGVCTVAARECIKVALRHRELRPDTPIWFSQQPLFTSAMILIICARDTDVHASTVPPINVAEDLKLAEAAADVLSDQAERWPSSQFYA